MKTFLITGIHTWSLNNNPAKQGFRAMIVADSEYQIRETYDFSGVEDLKILPQESTSIPFVYYCSHPFTVRR